MTDEPQTLDAEVVEEPKWEMVPATPVAHPPTLFRTDDPTQVLKRATSVANTLAPVLRAQNMVVRVGHSDHVTVEGWLTLGSMLGVTPVGVWTRKLDNGWEAKVNAQTLDGRVIGSAEAMCQASEDNWKDSDEFAVRSMAQTRATSKALASVLRFVVTLAGFSGTPAEEMQGKAQVRTANNASRNTPASKKQTDWLLGEDKGKGRKGGLIEALTPEAQEQVKAWLTNENGDVSKRRASFAISCLSDKDDEHTASELLAKAGVSDLPADTEGLGEPEESPVT